MTQSTIIGIMGPGKTLLEEEEKLAYALGKAIAQEHWILLTGGRPTGVMAAASCGAASAGGTVIGVLPDSQGHSIAAGVTIPILTGIGHARNAINVLSSHAIIACGLGLGTVSEIALALKEHKPVVLMPHNPLVQDFFNTLAPGQFHMTDEIDACVRYLKKMLHP
ncbi:MAG: TIGR00725 family protein [Cyanobacteria bacterium P01_D01_bin.156]